MLVNPGSQHAKYLPIIRETIAKANPKRIFENFKQCTDGVKIPTVDDVRRREHCTLEEAAGNGLFNKEGLELVRRVFEEKFAKNLVMEGTDGFAYQVDIEGKPQKAYALLIEGAKITGRLWTGLAQANGLRGFQAAETQISKILNEETPTFELSSNMALAEECIFFSDLAAVLPIDRQNLWIEITSTLERALDERGYRSDGNVSTWQEHRLGGSTISISYSEQPYKPLGLIHAEMKDKNPELIPLEIGEARQARELNVFTGVHYEYYGILDEGKRLPVFFEPLDFDGNTVRDPRAIDITHLGEFLKLHPLEEAIEKCLVPNVVKRADYPNRRD